MVLSLSWAALVVSVSVPLPDIDPGEAREAPPKMAKQQGPTRQPRFAASVAGARCGSGGGGHVCLQLLEQAIAQPFDGVDRAVQLDGVVGPALVDVLFRRVEPAAQPDGTLVTVVGMAGGGARRDGVVADLKARQQRLEIADDVARLAAGGDAQPHRQLTVRAKPQAADGRTDHRPRQGAAIEPRQHHQRPGQRA